MRFRLAIALAALLFSTGGAAIKLSVMSGWQVACLRSAIAAAVLAATVKSARDIFHPRIMLVGLAYAATMVLYVLSNKLTTAANAIFLQGSAPLYILLMGPWLLKEKLKRNDFLLMTAIALGLALFFVQHNETTASAPNPALGNTLAALTGISWALTLTGLRWLERQSKSGAGLQAVVAGNLLAALLALPMALPVAGRAIDWSVVGYLGVVQIGLAYVFLTYGFRRVGAFEASLIILLEPALSPVWAWLIHNEVPGTLAIIGGLLIVGATTLKGWFERPSTPAPS